MQLRLTDAPAADGRPASAWRGGRCDMLCEHAKQRETFGVKLAERQAIQWWVADIATRIHACRLMVQDAADKTDRGEDVRQRGFDDQGVRHRDGLSRSAITPCRRSARWA